jgi:histidinol-phosphatase
MMQVIIHHLFITYSSSIKQLLKMTETMTIMQKYLDLALSASKLAQTIIMEAYSKNQFEITIKEDQTPVTEVDVAVEQAIKSYISKAYPDHGFYGEEEGQQDIDAEFVWLIDPIDGTKAFVRGRPFFSCQIALMRNIGGVQEIILGVSRAPAFNGGEVAYALKGHGAFLNDKRINVSDINALNQAVFSSGNIKSLAQDAGLWAKYATFLNCINTTRGFGDFLQYHLLASGKLDIIIESDVSILDVAALSVIVSEAGGKMTQLDGAPLTLQSRSILAANPVLYHKTLGHFGAGQK